MKTVYLSLGSNLGDREQALRTAIRKLQTKDFHVLRISSIYETAAVDETNQPDFFNCVLEAQTELFPMRLLLRVSNIELEMGRKRLKPKGPRSIDIDILLHGTSVVDTPQLQIPHPRMGERRFVLQPLAELAPDLRHPVSKLTIREMLTATAQQRVSKTGLILEVPVA